jgi:preprotein translocase subunit SecD
MATGGWRILTATLVLLVGCSDPAAKPDPSYFTIRPVTRQTAPPCARPALPELQNGQAVRCYELGPAGVDADDVQSATIIRDPQTSAPEVEFDLSPQGVERFNAMAKAVGVGGQAAVVVDGIVASAPRLDTTDFPGRGAVTGLGEEQAQRLATRLNHG